MADSNVPITAGSGTSIDTFTQASGDHRQAVVIGDPSASNVAGVDASTRLHVNIAGSSGLNPSSTGSLTAAAASTVTGAASSTGTTVLDVSAAGNASFHLLTSAFVGAVVFEQSFDPSGGSGTWASIPVIPEDTLNAPMNTVSINVAAAYIRQFTSPMFGPSLFRVRCSAFTSGSLTVLARGGPGWYEAQPALAPSINNIGIVDTAAATAATTSAVTLSATANTNTAAVAADTTRKGLIIMNNNVSAAVLLSPGSTATTASLYAYKLMPGQGVEIAAPFAKLAVQAQANVASATIAVTAGTGL